MQVTAPGRGGGGGGGGGGEGGLVAEVRRSCKVPDEYPVSVTLTTYGCITDTGLAVKLQVAVVLADTTA